MSGHTPGPWETINGDEHDFSINHDGDCEGLFERVVASGYKVIGNPEMDEMAVIIVDMNLRNTWDDDLLDANAALVMAAPELLAACKSAQEYLSCTIMEAGQEVFLELTAAIARATAPLTQGDGQ